MAGQIGQIRDGEYWMRCPFCGDTNRHPTKCHFSIKLRTGQYNCHRCSTGGRFTSAETFGLTGQYPKLTRQQPVQLSQEERKEVDLVVLERMLLPGPGTSRSSCLERFHISAEVKGQGQTFDVFKLRDAKGNLIGFNIRGRKYHRTLGHRGLAYVGPYLKGPRIRIVEGPYDVITEMDVATVGFPTRAQLRQMKSYSLVLCPDGDVLASNMMALRYLSCFSKRGRGGPLINHMEILPDGLDPDEVLPQHRKVIPFGRQRLLRLVKDLDNEQLSISDWAREAV